MLYYIFWCPLIYAITAAYIKEPKSHISIDTLLLKYKSINNAGIQPNITNNTQIPIILYFSFLGVHNLLRVYHNCFAVVKHPLQMLHPNHLLLDCSANVIPVTFDTPNHLCYPLFMSTTINNNDFIKALILDYFHSILPSTTANIPDLVVKIYSLNFLKSNYLPINAISAIYNIPIYLIKSFISCNIIYKYSYNGYTLISTIEIEKAIIHFQSQLSKLEANNNPYFYYYLPVDD